MKYENEMEIDVGRCLRALVKRWRFLIVMAILCGVAGFILTMEKKEDTYQATSSVYAMSGDSYSSAQVGVSAMNDYADIADYAQESIEALYRGGVINGMENGDFRPQANATRAETAKMIFSVLQKMGG